MSGKGKFKFLTVLSDKIKSHKKSDSVEQLSQVSEKTPSKSNKTEKKKKKKQKLPDFIQRSYSTHTAVRTGSFATSPSDTNYTGSKPVENHPKQTKRNSIISHTPGGLKVSSSEFNTILSSVLCYDNKIETNSLSKDEVNTETISTKEIEASSSAHNAVDTANINVNVNDTSQVAEEVKDCLESGPDIPQITNSDDAILEDTGNNRILKDNIYYAESFNSIDKNTDAYQSFSNSANDYSSCESAVLNDTLKSSMNDLPISIKHDIYKESLGEYNTLTDIKQKDQVSLDNKVEKGDDKDSAIDSSAPFCNIVTATDLPKTLDDNDDDAYSSESLNYETKMESAPIVDTPLIADITSSITREYHDEYITASHDFGVSDTLNEINDDNNTVFSQNHKSFPNVDIPLITDITSSIIEDNLDDDVYSSESLNYETKMESAPIVDTPLIADITSSITREYHDECITASHGSSESDILNEVKNNINTVFSVIPNKESVAIVDCPLITDIAKSVTGDNDDTYITGDNHDTYIESQASSVSDTPNEVNNNNNTAFSVSHNLDSCNEMNNSLDTSYHLMPSALSPVREECVPTPIAEEEYKLHANNTKANFTGIEETSNITYNNNKEYHKTRTAALIDSAGRVITHEFVDDTSSDRDIIPNSCNNNQHLEETTDKYFKASNGVISDTMFQESIDNIKIKNILRSDTLSDYKECASSNTTELSDIEKSSIDIDKPNESIIEEQFSDNSDKSHTRVRSNDMLEDEDYVVDGESSVYTNEISRYNTLDNNISIQGCDDAGNDKRTVDVVLKPDNFYTGNDKNLENNNRSKQSDVLGNDKLAKTSNNIIPTINIYKYSGSSIESLTQSSSSLTIDKPINKKQFEAKVVQNEHVDKKVKPSTDIQPVNTIANDHSCINSESGFTNNGNLSEYCYGHSDGEIRYTDYTPTFIPLDKHIKTCDNVNKNLNNNICTVGQDKMGNTDNDVLADIELYNELIKFKETKRNLKYVKETEIKTNLQNEINGVRSSDKPLLIEGQNRAVQEDISSGIAKCYTRDSVTKHEKHTLDTSHIDSSRAFKTYMRSLYEDKYKSKKYEKSQNKDYGNYAVMDLPPLPVEFNDLGEDVLCYDEMETLNNETYWDETRVDLLTSIKRINKFINKIRTTVDSKYTKRHYETKNEYFRYSFNENNNKYDDTKDDLAITSRSVFSHKSHRVQNNSGSGFYTDIYMNEKSVIDGDTHRSSSRISYSHRSNLNYVGHSITRDTTVKQHKLCFKDKVNWRIENFNELRDKHKRGQCLTINFVLSVSGVSLKQCSLKLYPNGLPESKRNCALVFKVDDYLTVPLLVRMHINSFTKFKEFNWMGIWTLTSNVFDRELIEVGICVTPKQDFSIELNR